MPEDNRQTTLKMRIRGSVMIPNLFQILNVRNVQKIKEKIENGFLVKLPFSFLLKKSQEQKEHIDREENAHPLRLISS